MTQKTLELKQLFEAKIAAVTQTAEVEQLRIEFLGKKGSVAALMQELRNVPNGCYATIGQVSNVEHANVSYGINSPDWCSFLPPPAGFSASCSSAFRLHVPTPPLRVGVST